MKSAAYPPGLDMYRAGTVLQACVELHFDHGVGFGCYAGKHCNGGMRSRERMEWIKLDIKNDKIVAPRNMNTYL